MYLGFIEYNSVVYRRLIRRLSDVPDSGMYPYRAEVKKNLTRRIIRNKPIETKDRQTDWRVHTHMHTLYIIYTHKKTPILYIYNYTEKPLYAVYSVYSYIQRNPYILYVQRNSFTVCIYIYIYRVSTILYVYREIPILYIYVPRNPYVVNIYTEKPL